MFYVVFFLNQVFRNDCSILAILMFVHEASSSTAIPLLLRISRVTEINNVGGLTRSNVKVTDKINLKFSRYVQVIS